MQATIAQLLDSLLVLLQFRNAGHLHWFVSSMVLLASCFLVYFRTTVVFVILAAFWLHMVAGSVATFVVFIEQESSSIYSGDCVWFNFLLALIYSILLIKQLKKKKRLFIKKS